MDMDFSSLENALKILGKRLLQKNLQYEVVAIGGGSLVLLGYLDRTTKDLDLVAILNGEQLMSASPLPHKLQEEIIAIGRALDLGDHWINEGPSSLLESGLPKGFRDRLIKRDFDGLTVYFAGRLDHICFKLYASIDQGPSSKHFADLKTLKPSQEELKIASEWCLTQDVSKEFSVTLKEALRALGVENEESK